MPQTYAVEMHLDSLVLDTFFQDIRIYIYKSVLLKVNSLGTSGFRQIEDTLREQLNRRRAKCLFNHCQQDLAHYGA